VWIDTVLQPLDGPHRVLILGATPELARLGWPHETHVYGVDRSLDMIRSAWPQQELNREGLGINGDWRHLPLADASMSVVIGDGSYSNVETVADYELLSAEVQRVLRPGGHLIIRLYVRPDREEDPSAVIATLGVGTDNFNAFKLRLMMAMAPEPHFEVRVADIFDVWTSHQLDYDRIASQTGIPRETIATIDNYEGSPARYNFPPMEFVLEHFSRYFDLVDTAQVTSYGLADRCPTLLLARR
jgi:SAM-dependent methyltransferase